MRGTAYGLWGLDTVTERQAVVQCRRLGVKMVRQKIWTWDDVQGEAAGAENP